MKFNTLFIFLLSATLLATLNGCIYYQFYPNEWAELDTATDCPVITGEYKNIGQSSSNYSPSLFEALIGNHNNAEEIDTVKIFEENETIKLQGFTNGQIIGERIIPYNKDVCANGYIEIEDPTPEGGINREGVVGYSQGSYEATKALDGSLVLQYDSSGIGIVLLVPFAGADRTWYSFQQKNKPNKLINRTENASAQN